MSTATITVSCARTGDSFNLAVPAEHEHDPIGWGDAARVHWSDENEADPELAKRYGRLVAKGLAGVTVRDHRGKEHRLLHGAYSIYQPERLIDMGKAVGATTTPKSGQRWITVHPNGPDEKGVPVLIEQNPDKTWSVIAGAGGKLSHLRLRKVGEVTPEKQAEWASTSKDRKKKKAAEDAARRGSQTDEEAAAEREAKKKAADDLRMAERSFIHKMRATVGGVDEDLDEKKLVGLSPGARNLIVGNHHRRQLRQAITRQKEIAGKLVDNASADEAARNAVERAVDEHPELAEARAMATEVLELRATEAEEARAARAAKKSRTAVAPTRPEADLVAIDEIKKAADPAAEITKLGGDDEAGKALRSTLTASDEVRRRSLLALAEAKKLADAAEGKPVALPDAVKKDLDEMPPEEHAAHLHMLAGQKFRRSEVLGHRSERLAEVATEDGEEIAARQLATTDVLTGIARAASTARELGLTDTEKVPLTDATLAEFKELMGAGKELDNARAEYASMNKAIDKGDYDRSRRAFELSAEEVSTAVEQTLAEGMQRAYTEKLRGVSDQTSSEWMGAATAGHYDGLSDVALGIGGQRYLDRPTVDALGLKNASALQRWAMERDGHAPGDVLAAVEEHHIEAVTKKADAALAKADAWVPKFTATVEDAGSLEEALGRLDAHEADLAEVQKTVGSAMGQLEATATIGQAFREKVPSHLEVAVGDAGLGGTLQWMHSIGLRPEDYSVDYAAKKVAIPQSSWAKLVRPVDAATVATRKSVDEIKSGKHDENGWLPPGIVSRPASTFTANAPVPERYFAPLNTGAGDLDGELRDHVGGRLAEGEPPESIAHDLLSATQVGGVGARRDEYIGAVKGLFPFRDEATGEMRPASAFADHFEKIAADWSAKTGKDAYHGQDLHPEDPDTAEAAFRALAAEPRNKYAFTPAGELDHEGRRAIRNFFYERMGLGEKRDYADRYKKELDELGPEPSKTAGTMSMFGGGGPSPEWEDWRRKAQAVVSKYPREGLELGRKLLGDAPARQSGGIPADKRAALEAAFAEKGHVRGAAEATGLPEDVAGRHLAPEVHAAATASLEGWAKKSSTPWAQYVTMHGDVETATAALQDEMKHRFIDKFTEHYGKVTGKPLRRGVEDVTNRERHVFATGTPEQQSAYRAQRAKDLAELQGRDVGGKYSDMGGAGKLLEEEAKERGQSTLMGQLQGGMFGGASKPKPPELKKPGTGQRWSLGDRAESQLASLLPHVGQALKDGKPVDLYPGLSMDGPRVEQQRALKTIGANGGRLGGFLGVGSGKTLISTGAFTQAHAAGKAERGLTLAPVAVQDQFGAEMSRFTEPGKYKIDTGAGKDHAGRVAMLADKSLHMGVMTHQAFRETMVKMMAEHHGRSVEQMGNDMQSADPTTAAKWLRETLDAHGVTSKLFTYIDEAHGSTSQDDENPSLFAAVSRALTHPMNSGGGMLLGTATPVKNTEAELHSMAAMLDPAKYGDRDKFMSAFGHELAHNPEAVRRELSHLTYTAKVEPENVEKLVSSNPAIENGAKVTDRPLKLTGAHADRVAATEAAYAAARKARVAGGVDLEALKTLSPKSFAGQPEGDHADIAKRLTESLGMVKEAAMRRAVNGVSPDNVKVARMTDVIKHDLDHGTWKDTVTGEVHKGKPSIVFSDRATEVHDLVAHLAKQGIRAVAYHGGLTNKERENIRLGFQPEGGVKPKYDVLVATSSAEAGINLQRAKAVHHYDVPQTHKSWEQRTGRAYRQKQRGDVDVHDWHVDHEFEDNARRRLRRKEGLGSVFEDPIGSMDERGIAGTYGRVLAAKHQSSDWDSLATQQEPAAMAAK